MKIIGYRVYMQRVANRPRVLLRLDTDEGVSGWGESFNHGPDKALPPYFEYLFRQIEGLDPRRIEFIMQKLMILGRFPPGAVGLAAHSAIDHALWDISAKAVGLPVYMIAGGNVRDRVRAYAGIMLGPQDGSAARELMQDYHERFGFNAFKLHPVDRSFHEGRWGAICDLYQRFSMELRESSPPDWEFGWDFKGAPGEFARARQLGDALAPSDPMLYEEPLTPYHEPEWARLRAALRVPLATGERLYSRHEFLPLMAVGGVDIIQPDIAVVGGFLEMKKIAAIAEAHLVTVSPHNPMGPIATAASVHFCASQPNVRILECNVHDSVPWILDPYVARDGHFDLRPDRPGWGVELDEAWLEKGEDYVHWQRPHAVRADGSIGIV